MVTEIARSLSSDNLYYQELPIKIVEKKLTVEQKEHYDPDDTNTIRQIL
jgi:hypothetical protein